MRPPTKTSGPSTRLRALEYAPGNDADDWCAQVARPCDGAPAAAGIAAAASTTTATAQPAIRTRIGQP